MTPAATGTGQPLVRRIRYNARGQRTLIEYGNGVTTEYGYEDDTFRLSTLRTRRSADSFPDDGPAPGSSDTRRGVQDLTYVYDPVGNITHIADKAQPRVFHLNTLIDASTDYEYDALYRLVRADGREHLGLLDAALAPPSPTSATDIPRVHPADRNALGRYRERYTYDVAGNLTELRHRGTNPRHRGWTRTFTCTESSRLEPSRAGVYGNRLTTTVDSTAASGPPARRDYHHDARGNMDLLPPLQLLRWDHHDRLQATASQPVASGFVPETTYYCYDSAGQRVRQIRDRQADAPEDAAPIDERIYLGDYELYRAYGSAGEVTLERTTVHVMDGGQRVALVETRTEPAAATDPDRVLLRYQHGNHLDSATVELDADGVFISYEEHYTYGCTALAFARSGVPPKRYRYTAKERDPTGLYYHGARYYAPWLGRWTACDPSGSSDGWNFFAYCRGNPVTRRDRNGLAGSSTSNASKLHFAYDLDHWQSQSEYSELSNKASNIGIMNAYDNRAVKGAREFSVLPPPREPASLKKAMSSEKMFTELMTETLGSRRLAEVVELNELWQIASKNETLSYEKAGPEFRHLLATSDHPSAVAAREAFRRAGVNISASKTSASISLNDQSYVRTGSKPPTVEELKESLETSRVTRGQPEKSGSSESHGIGPLEVAQAFHDHMAAAEHQLLSENPTKLTSDQRDYLEMLGYELRIDHSITSQYGYRWTRPDDGFFPGPSFGEYATTFIQVEAIQLSRLINIAATALKLIGTN
ncbi:RHS repeat-associated core domain-containing protein [Nonomuraea wenchangensis]|uniref:RHS repeat-associated core domain-containing protein n=1 Tax=Nonomuraea wenchangensis TaxID=568860 RepID=UPI00384B1225